MLEEILKEIEEATNQEDAPIYCGSMEVDGYVRMSVVKDIISKHMTGGWIPVEDQDRQPKDDEYILLSFENFDLPMVGRYEENKEGGAFYLGDEEDTCVSQDLYVNAWQPLPKPYSPKKGAEE